MADFQVVKRSGKRQAFSEEKVLQRIEALMMGLDRDHISPELIVQKTIRTASDNMSTHQLDEFIAETAAYLGTQHPDYSTLAGRLAVTNLHKRTFDSFVSTVELLYRFRNPQTQGAAPLVTQSLYETACAHGERIDREIDHTRSYRFDFFGFRTLERSYLLRVENRKIAERPQHMFMRVALGIHGEDIDAALETYHLMSTGSFIHASPTLFNAGTPRPQLSSCFLVAMKDDSIEGIYDTLKSCALISKSAGGIGLHCSNIRAQGSYIRGTNGLSNGLVPMLRVFNDTARYVDQGGGKRKGAFAVYLEPWHADVFEFLKLRTNTGKEETRARDLFYALWMPDLFMERVEANGQWSLMCPNESPGLQDVWGDDFAKLYEKYEAEGKFRKQIKARTLWMAILEAQIETGNPYMLYKDACNRKSNQQNLGTIKCSNLCTEIVEYTSPDESAVCNLASIALSTFVKDDNSGFDYERLYKVTRVVTKNLNKVIDVNTYPTPETQRSNFRHRPIGIGVQGLADVFAKLRIPFTSEQALDMNRDIFETLLFASMDQSCDIAREVGPYESYAGSPVSKGIFQFDMWGVEPKSGRWDWASLKQRVAQYGIRNSLLMAPMPTASTSQILGNNECFEPFTSNIYVRRCLSGEFPLVNKYLVKDLSERGLWNDSVRQTIIAHNGSIQHVDLIPDDIKELYKTVWEMRQRHLLDMAIARGAFIDQSQSLNVFMESPTASSITSMHFYAWKGGLKTGMYYLRTRPAVDAIKFTVDTAVVATAAAVKNAHEKKPVEETKPHPDMHSPSGKRVCTDAATARPSPDGDGEEEGCLMCGS